MALSPEEKAQLETLKAQFTKLTAERARLSGKAQPLTAVEAVAQKSPDASFISDEVTPADSALTAARENIIPVPGQDIVRGGTAEQLNRGGFVSDPGAGPVLRIKAPDPTAPSSEEYQAGIEKKREVAYSANPTVYAAAAIPSMVAGGAVFGGASKPAAPLAEGFISRLRGGAEKIGLAFKDWANDMSAATLGMTKNEIKDLGLDKTRKLGEYLIKLGATDRPAMLSTVEREIGSTRKMVGKKIEQLTDELSKEPDVAPTLRDLKAGIFREVVKPYEADGVPIPDKVLETVEKQLTETFKDLPPDTLIAPNLMRKIAQRWEDLAGSWRADLSKKSEEATAVVWDDMASSLRRLNSTLAKESPNPAVQTLPALNEHYHFLKKASEGLTDEVAASRTKYNIASLEGIKRSYAATLGSQPVRGATVGTANWVANTLKNNAKALGKYQKVFENAAARGAGAIAATHYSLMSGTDPEYRVLVKSLEEKEASRAKKSE